MPSTEAEGGASIAKIKPSDVDLSGGVQLLVALATSTIGIYTAVTADKDDDYIGSVATSITSAGALLLNAGNEIYKNMSERVAKEHADSVKRQGNIAIEEKFREKAIAHDPLFETAFGIADKIKKLQKTRSVNSHVNSDIHTEIEELMKAARNILDQHLSNGACPAHSLLASGYFSKALLLKSEKKSPDEQKAALEESIRETAEYIRRNPDEKDILPFMYQLRSKANRMLFEQEQDPAKQKEYFENAFTDIKDMVLDTYGFNTGQVYHDIGYLFHLRADSPHNVDARYDLQRATDYYRLAQGAGESVIINLAEVLVKQNKYAEAAIAIKPILDRNLKHPLIQEAYAQALIGIPGNEFAAYKHYQEALKYSSNPDSITSSFSAAYIRVNATGNFDAFCDEMAERSKSWCHRIFGCANTSAVPLVQTVSR